MISTCDYAGKKIIKKEEIMMGKNRNRNIVRGKIRIEGYMALVKGLVNMNHTKIAEMMTNDTKVQRVLTKLFDTTETKNRLELDRHEVETVCRAILSTSEFSTGGTAIDDWCESFIGHLYTETLSIGQFGVLVEELLGSPVLRELTELTHEIVVTYTAVAWIMVRTVFQDILNTADVTSKKNTSPTKQPVRTNNVEINVYVLTPEQEQRAKKLGVEIKDHLLNIDTFYQHEADLVAEWSAKSDDSFKPVHEMYGMNVQEYRKWRGDVAVLFNEIIASNAIDETTTQPPSVVVETVASRNIGTPTTKSIADQVAEFLKNPGETIGHILKNPNMIKSMRDTIKDDVSFHAYVDGLTDEYVHGTDPLVMYYDISAKTTDVDGIKVVRVTKDIANRIRRPERDVFPYVMMLLVEDNAFIDGALKFVCKESVLKRITMGSFANHELAMYTKKWIHTHNPVDFSNSNFESIFDVIKNAFDKYTA